MLHADMFLDELFCLEVEDYFIRPRPQILKQRIGLLKCTAQGIRDDLFCYLSFTGLRNHKALVLQLFYDFYACFYGC